MNNSEFLVKSYTHQELAACYQCSAKTLRRWVRHLKNDLGPRIGHSYSPRQVRIIVERIGEP